MRLRSKGAGQIGNRKFTHLSEHPEEKWMATHALY